MQFSSEGHAVSEAPVIELQNVTVSYRDAAGWADALRQITLQIAPSEIHGLVGESGSGKTTLALAMMRYLGREARITSGSIRFLGEDLLKLSPSQLRAIWGGQMALVPQDPLAALNPAYTVGDQIAEVARTHQRLGRRAARLHAVEMLERVRIANPGQVARKYPHQLSGGMQQRVTIAMALSTQPRLLILDEPTTALDVTTEATVLDLFRDLIRENNAAALFVSHNLGVIAQMCDRVTVLYAGEIMAAGAVRGLYGKPLHPYTIGLLASIPRPLPGVETRLPAMDGIAPPLREREGGCVFAARCPLALPLCHAQKPALESPSPGRWVKCHRWQEIAAGDLALDTAPQSAVTNGPAPVADELVLQASDLSKTFVRGMLFDRLMGSMEAVHALDDASIRVRARATLGLVGESGSGKTTLARCIVGLESADSGTMALLDMPLSASAAARPQAVRRNLQMIFQNPNDTLNPYRTVGDTLRRAIRKLNGAPQSTQAVEARVHELLAQVRLPPDYVDRLPGELSGGEKQRVAIARAFAAHPALVVADEPTSALDVSVQAVILNLLKDLRAQQGVSYLFISHDLRAVAYLADWIAVMYLGQIVEEGTTEQVYGFPSHPYTEALISAIPEPDPTRPQGHIRLDGELPSDTAAIPGCRFHTRCPRKIGTICEQAAPPWQDAGDGHRIRCHIPADELAQLQQNSLVAVQDQST